MGQDTNYTRTCFNATLSYSNFSRSAFFPSSALFGREANSPRYLTAYIAHRRRNRIHRYVGVSNLYVYIHGELFSRVVCTKSSHFGGVVNSQERFSREPRQQPTTESPYIMAKNARLVHRLYQDLILFVRYLCCGTKMFVSEESDFTSTRSRHTKKFWCKFIFFISIRK